MSSPASTISTSNKYNIVLAFNRTEDNPIVKKIENLFKSWVKELPNVTLHSIYGKDSGYDCSKLKIENSEKILLAPMLLYPRRVTFEELPGYEKALMKIEGLADSKISFWGFCRCTQREDGIGLVEVRPANEFWFSHSVEEGFAGGNENDVFTAMKKYISEKIV
jgi:hypothetical protein